MPRRGSTPAVDAALPSSRTDLVVARPQGLYCPPGDFYIDPWQPVDRALVTHAHGDHLRPGSARYLAAAPGERVLRARVGEVDLQVLAYGERLVHNGVAISFHPAGHVLGSAQVRLEHGGSTWVVSGDYKTGPDATCQPFEPVRCDTFVTESTFGLPVFRWRPQRAVFDDELPNAINEAIITGFSHPAQKRLLAGYTQRYFDDVAGVWERRSSERAQPTVVGLFPAWAVDPETVAAADAWLAQDRPPALRRLVSEGRAGIVRALAARDFDRS